MLVPNRHGSSSSYRYGFNGKEKDDELKGEGNSYDFGERMLDARVGRWFSIDPLFTKFPNWSPYNSFSDNPIQNTDPDGKEPNRAQATTIKEFIQYCKINKLYTIKDIYQHLKSNATTVLRYVYTEKNGWIDLNHVFCVLQNGKIPTDALEPISGNKTLRDNFLHGNGAKSYYSYEDLPSNEFANTIDCNQPDTITEYAVIDGEPKEREELFRAIESKFVNAKTTNPASAPNWKKIPEKEDRDVLYDKNGNVRELTKEELNSGKYVPQNHSSKPYKLENFPAAPTSLEKENKKDKKDQKR